MSAERPARVSEKNPLLLRRPLLDAVEHACSALGGAPAPAAAVARLAPRLGLKARGLTVLLRQVAALGPDAAGRTLLELRQRSSTALWAVLAPSPTPAAPLPASERLLRLALPNEPFESVLLRAIAALEREQTPAQGIAQPHNQAQLPPPPPPLPTQSAPAAGTEPQTDPIQAPAKPEPEEPGFMNAWRSLNAEAQAKAEREEALLQEVLNDV